MFPGASGIRIPLPLLSDSYKLTHNDLYPPVAQMVGYGECRTAFNKDPEDSRIVFYGLRYIIEQYISKKWTIEDIEGTEKFCKTHNAGKTLFPWPKELFTKIVKEHGGYFPIKIEALPEGSIVYPHTPLFVVTAQGEFASLMTFLETILVMVWYPIAVATLSRRCKDLIEESFSRTVDLDNFWLLESRLHDFGFRGCTSVEQAMIGGASHLLNFTGSDTMVACYYVQEYLNNGNPIGESIPATEHSIMTSFLDEKEAFLHMIEQYGSGVFACVMDSYDYAGALRDILPCIAEKKCSRGGWMVLRPDSGDPVQVVRMALKAAEQVFGVSINQKGFKIIQGASIIQGDGISHEQIRAILQMVETEGFSAQNVAFGMGSNLLQRVHRDSCSLAFKLSHVRYQESYSKNAPERDVMKIPKLDSGKVSLPGQFYLGRSAHDSSEPSPIVVFPKESQDLPTSKSVLEVVYDHGPLDCIKQSYDSFQVIRDRVQKEWSLFPKHFDPISHELAAKISAIRSKKGL
jgi:nicotinic acid phosphoribosyltransferase